MQAMCKSCREADASARMFSIRDPILSYAAKGFLKKSNAFKYCGNLLPEIVDQERGKESKCPTLLMPFCHELLHRLAPCMNVDAWYLATYLLLLFLTMFSPLMRLLHVTLTVCGPKMHA